MNKNKAGKGGKKLGWAKSPAKGGVPPGQAKKAAKTGVPYVWPKSSKSKKP